MNVKGYDVKERFEFGVITSFAYPIEDSRMFPTVLLKFIADVQTKRLS